MNESIMRFGKDNGLFGILTMPETPGIRGPAIVILNTGLMHRVGPHRLHVKIARQCASLGFPVLRFDFSGLGESSPSTAAFDFLRSADSETRQAMDALGQRCGANHFILIGLCAGAAHAFQVASTDGRVCGAVLINGQDRRSSTLASYLRWKLLVRYQWRVALGHPRTYAKPIISLKPTLLAREALRHLVRAVIKPAAEYQQYSVAVQSQLLQLEKRGVRLLLIYAEGDESLDYFRYTLEGCCSAASNISVELISTADRLFTPLQSQLRLLAAISAWLTYWCSEEVMVIE